jgi:hypothetical protein
MWAVETNADRRRIEGDDASLLEVTQDAGPCDLEGVGHIGARETRQGAEVGRAVWAVWKCGLSFKSDEARCTATTAPHCSRSRVLLRK